jgi:hypothetical protein
MVSLYYTRYINAVYLEQVYYFLCIQAIDQDYNQRYFFES